MDNGSGSRPRAIPTLGGTFISKWHDFLVLNDADTALKPSHFVEMSGTKRHGPETEIPNALIKAPFYDPSHILILRGRIAFSYNGPTRLRRLVARDKFI